MTCVGKTLLLFVAARSTAKQDHQALDSTVLARVNALAVTVLSLRGSGEY